MTLAATDKVEILMRLTRQLIQVMEAEADTARRVKLAELGELQAEKQALSEVYEAEFNELRRAPEILGAVSPAVRAELEQATREFRDAARRNSLALEGARMVVERALHFIQTSLADGQSYAPSDGAARPRAAEVVPFALDRTC